jgi:hypothetical protein
VLEPCLVQFFHPGPEYDRTDDSAPWTSELQAHQRKFMVDRGLAQRFDQRIEGEVTFWGEWEPQAERVLTFEDTSPGMPRRLWRPFYSVPAAPPNRLNTDPLVFDGFRYTICQQHRNTGPTRLRDLGPGSVILFGSNLGGNFVLDTVFVVGLSRLHSASTFRRIKAPRWYFDVTLDTLYGEAASNGCCEPSAPGETYRLYEGATVDNPVDGMYSFVPCLQFKGLGGAFTRPVIRYQGISKAKTQGFGVPIVGDLDAIRAAWQDVKRQVLDHPAGLSLATWLDFPSEH